MARIFGVNIPDRKRLIISLTYIYGVGPAKAKEIVEKLSLNGDMRTQDLSEEDKGRINSLLQSDFVVEGDLRRQIQNDIRRLTSIKCYRGLRHRSGLPVRGQRTSTNARTRKGKVKTVAGKKK